MKSLFEPDFITKRFVIFVCIIISVVVLSIVGKMEAAIAGNIMIALIHLYREEAKGKRGDEE